MSENTANLELLKVNPITDGSDTFNFTTMLNDNWDKIDIVIGNMNELPTDIKTSLVASISELYEKVALSFPVGTYIDSLSNIAPNGFLRANGSAISISTYSNLATYLYCGDSKNSVASWGYKCTDVLNPSITRSISGNYIVLPDYRGEFNRTYDQGRGIDIDRGFWDFQEDELKSHRHYINSWSSDTNPTAYVDQASGGTAGSIYTNYTGGVETRPRNLVSYRYIKY